MKLLLDVEKSKVGFVLELLENLPFVKATKVSEAKPGKVARGQRGSAKGKEEVLSGLRTAVAELALVKAGKLKTRTLQEFLDEL